jgi:hypothetical protein
MIYQSICRSTTLWDRGGGTPAHRAGGILENIGQFSVLGLRNILLPTPGKRKVKVEPKMKMDLV